MVHTRLVAVSGVACGCPHIEVRCVGGGRARSPVGEPVIGPETEQL